MPSLRAALLAPVLLCAAAGIEPYSALRLEDWKLLYFHAGPRFELYDLAADLGDTTDRAADEPAVLARLAGVLSDELARAGAQMSIDIESGVPVPLPRAALEER